MLCLSPCYGQKELDLALGDQDVTLKGVRAYDECGTSIAMGDINGDGLDDLLISAPRAGNSERTPRGAVYVVLGRDEFMPPEEIDLEGDVDFVISTDSEYEYLGAFMAVGDVNADGYDDVLISAPLANGLDDEEDCGQVYLILGRAFFPPYFNVKTDADTIFYGINDGDNLGLTLHFADLNDDGFDDILLPATKANGVGETKEDCGEIYVLYGRTEVPPVIELDKFFDVVIYGKDAYDNLGNAICTGDVDGDGFVDLIFSANLADGEWNQKDQCGEVYIISKFMDYSGEINMAVEEPTATIYGITTSDRLGGSITILDMNHDGHDDIVMQSPHVDHPNGQLINVGQIYVLFGGSPFTTINDLSSSYDVTMYGLNSNDSMGHHLDSGDLNGDGITDLIVTVHRGAGPENQRGGCGEVYVIYGKDELPVELTAENDISTIIYGGNKGDALGYSVCTGHFNNDGITDLIMGAPKAVYGDRGTNTGEVYVIRGGNKRYVITGTGYGTGNAAWVKTFGAYPEMAGKIMFLAYPSDDFGCNVSAGDLQQDDVDEIITGLGPGPDYPPNVRCFHFNGQQRNSFLAYGVKKFGVNTAIGDLNGDGTEEILTGPGPGAVFGPHVRGWDLEGARIQPISIVSFIAYGTRKFGVNVSCGDVDADGFAEIITGAGEGKVFGPHVRGFNFDGVTVTSINEINFFAYGTRRFGVKVKTGEIDQDGFAEIVTTPGPGPIFGPHVRGWNYDGISLTSLKDVSYFAYTRTLKHGCNAGCGDIDQDGVDEIVTGPGPGAWYGSHIRGWNYDGSALSAMSEINFFAYDGNTKYGANTAVGSFGL
jgi:hypothetical protein